MSRAERLLLAQLEAGRAWSGDLKVSFYQPLGISAVHLDMAYRQLMAKLASVSEFAKERANDLARKVASKKTDIKRKTLALARAKKARGKLAQELATISVKVEMRRASMRIAVEKHRADELFALKQLLIKHHARTAAFDTTRVEIKELRFALHQHKRRLAILEGKHAKACGQAVDPTICFGSKKLFREQFVLNGNGYADHDEWLVAWRGARSAQFTLDGNSSKEGGNQFAWLRPCGNGRFDLELRLPKALAHLATRTFKVSGQTISCIDLPGLSFNHGNDVIEEALASSKPVTVKFLRDAKSWKVMVSVDHALDWKMPDFSAGALGVDLNAGHVSAALVDREGNPVEVFKFPCVTYGKTTDQTQYAIRKVAAKISALAERLGVPVVCEQLDFSERRKTLKDAKDARYARMLSSFAYSAFGRALGSACARRGVALRRVNPAYTSIIGRVKFARRYGLSVHEAASVAIARRAMGYSERLPRSSTDTVTVPTNGCVHVTLDLPVRKDASEHALKSRHVWSRWNGLNKEYQKALAALGSSRRKPRPKRGKSQAWGRQLSRARDGILAGGADNRSMVLRRRQDVPAERRFSHDARGGQRARK